MLDRNIVSVDVEDYFQVESFAGIVSRDSWDSYTSRVCENTMRLLDVFDSAGVSATFFTLGWVAERFPHLLQEIVVRKHELACHSYWHEMVTRLSPGDFRDDTARAKNSIEQAIGQSIVGYRAPTFSINRKSWWAFEILTELGFTYDSSVFPIRHDRYGVSDAPRVPFAVTTDSGTIMEYPLTTFRLPIGPNLPVGGGGYLRLLPELYTRLGVRKAAQQGIPTIIYLHPWEIDPDQPRLPVGWKTGLRHYANLGKMTERLRSLLSMGSFSSFRDYREATLLDSSQMETRAAVLTGQGVQR